MVVSDEPSVGGDIFLDSERGVSRERHRPEAITNLLAARADLDCRQ